MTYLKGVSKKKSKNIKGEKIALFNLKYTLPSRMRLVFSEEAKKLSGLYPYDHD